MSDEYREADQYLYVESCSFDGDDRKRPKEKWVNGPKAPGDDHANRSTENPYVETYDETDQSGNTPYIIVGARDGFMLDIDVDVGEDHDEVFAGDAESIMCPDGVLGFLSASGGPHRILKFEREHKGFAGATGVDLQGDMKGNMGVVTSPFHHPDYEITHEPTELMRFDNVIENEDVALNNGLNADLLVDDAPEEFKGEKQSLDAAASDYSGDDWLDVETASEALEYVDPDIKYDVWRNIGFGLADEFPAGTAEALFTHWSSGGQKWDDDAERLAESIINDANPAGAGDPDISTLVWHAKDAGWEPPTGAPKPQEPDVTAASEAVANAESTETDGGVATESPSAESGPSPSSSRDRTIEERILSRVLRPYDADEDSIDVQTAVNRVADEFDEEWHFVYPERDVPGWRETLHVYNPHTGVYEPRGEAFVQFQAERLLNAFATNTRVNEIVEKIVRRNIERGPAFEVSPHRLVVGNGILDLHTGELDDFDPEEYHATRIGVDYKPDAACPGIDEFFHEIVKDDDVGTLYRVAAHTLYKDYIGSKTVMLVGGGSNGKTMYTWLLEQLLNPTDTEKNTTGISLGEISESDNNFAVSNLYGKMANINADINSSDVNDLGPLKRLTGGDLMDADVKYESRVRFRNYASLIFAVNQMPSFSEDTHALWRRWVYLKFPYTFKPDDPETDPEHVVKDRIGNDAELEGLLARCVEEIQAWHNGREMYPDIPSPEQIREMMLRAAEPVYDFATVCLQESEEGQIRTEEVRSAFRDYARETGLGSAAAMDPGRFGEKLQSVAEFPIENKQVRQNGSRVRCYTGVDWTSRGEQIANGEAPKDLGQTGLDPEGIGKSYGEPTPPADAEGPEADAQRVRAILKDDGPLGDGELAAKAAERFDLAPPDVEQAVATLRQDGRITDDEDGYRAT